jgi:hypothetical protein
MRNTFREGAWRIIYAFGDGLRKFSVIPRHPLVRYLSAARRCPETECTNGA